MPILRRAAYIVMLLVLVSVIAGCPQKKAEKETVATIGKYHIYKEDLLSEAELYPPQYLKKISKEQFLDNLIEKKILLIEAQHQGLDKKPEFLKMIERFWEQSLLRSLLDEKSRQIRSSAKPGEGSRRQTEMMQEWVEGLKKNSTIKIYKDTLEKIELK